MLSIQQAQGESTTDRVFVTYSDVGTNDTQNVYLSILSPSLEPDGPPRRVGPADSGEPSDQFWPVSAVDSSTGFLYVCYYDTRGQETRRRAVFTCIASRNAGRGWSRPVKAALRASDETQTGADFIAYGDYEGLAVSKGIAYPLWTDSRNLATEQEEIYASRIPQVDFFP
jgi:hypothetical protein